MNIRLSRALAVSAVAAWAVGAALGHAAEFTMKFSSATPETENSFAWTHLKVLKQEIEARSGGQIEVEMYPGGQLGGIESLVNQVRDGIIQAADPADGHFAPLFPDIQVFGIPYVFVSREVAWRVLDGPFGEMMRDKMAEATGLRPLFWTENGGFRHYSVVGRELRSADDMAGIKMRTMNHPLHMEIASSLGMSPTPIAWGELYTALQTGVVEGQENSIPTFLLPKLYEVQDNIILDGHVYSINTVVVNEAWYQSLPEDLRAAVDQAAVIARTTNRGLSIANEIEGRAFLEEQGVTIYDPTAAEKAVFRERAQPPALEWLKTQIDPVLIDEMLAAVAEAEEYYGYR
ncbi:MAG: TRAP transporter substrate-binding protein DctP [Geminicoccaceae bacterium]|jgi:C4-dicarboxylate-binding protein DctP|nr:TRAP transporter substrate-binding protein DctP [Geminicoccaceae bacterium]HRY26464.1 TRAP transporter substrate-binding protein DctP [Geminicoccaceae bacterium]